jgi:hypothetical protein
MTLQYRRAFSAAVVLLALVACLIPVALAPMTVNVNPASKIVNVGETTTFTALVAGNTGVPSFKWYVNNVLQAQYTSSALRISEPEAGKYSIYVHVESGGQTVDSKAVTLTVNAAAATPTPVPTAVPTTAPTEAPTVAPTEVPTGVPTASPTIAPTSAPTATPGKTFAISDEIAFALVAVIVIVVIAVVVISLRKKK